MGRLSRTFLTHVALTLWIAAVVWGVSSWAAAQTPDRILGTADGSYQLFTPTEVAKAADSGVAFRFFRQESLTVPTVSTNTTIAASGDGYKFTLHPATTYSDGLAAGPFFTVYEGHIDVALTQVRTLHMAIETVHTFQDGTKLTSQRTLDFLSDANDFTGIPLTGFSSITNLPLGGTFRDDAGTVRTITAEFLAQPVSISVNAELTVLRAGSRTSGVMAGLRGESAAVTWYQLAVGETGGGGTPTPLSDATPKVESGAGAPGSATSASRGDHVHPARTLPAIPALSTATPKIESGSGAAGSGSAASRDDHVHPALAVRQLPANPSGLTNRYLRGRSTGANWQSGEIVPHFATGNKNDCLRINALGNAMTWVDCPSGGGGSSTFTGLSDTPSAYTGDGGKFVAVNSGATALEFVDKPSGGGNATPLSDAAPKLERGAGAAGVSTNASRGDHVHPAQALRALSDQTPKSSATSGAAGSAEEASRGDHVHPHPAPTREVPAPSVSTKGDIPRINAAGDAYEVVDPHVAIQSGLPALTGHGGNCLKVNSGATGLEFGACGGSSGGGGAAFATSLVGSFKATANVPYSKINLTDDQRTACRAADFFYVRAQGGSAGTFLAPLASNGETSASVTNRDVARTAWHSLFCPSTGTAFFEVQLSEAVSNSVTWDVFSFKIEGGGGAAGPTIPTPTAAGASKYLRINAAGAAYELGEELDAELDEIEGGLDTVQSVTQDLTVASKPTPWAKSTVSGAGVVAAACSTTTAPSSGYAVTINRPSNGWPANSCIFAQLPKGADVTTYRVTEPSGQGVTLIDPGGSWRLKLPTNPVDTSHDHYLVNTVSAGDMSLELEHGGNIQRTAYHGSVPSLERFIDDNSTKLQIIEGGPVGPKSPPLNSVWTVNECAGSGDNRTCDASWQPVHTSQKATVRTLVQHGTGAANATTASFAQFNKMRHGEIEAGRGYDEHILIVRHLAGNPQNLNIIQCRIPGIQGDWHATNSAAITLKAVNGSGCQMTVPPDGNITITWTAPLAGNKILGDTWRLYGVDWQ